MPRESWDLPDPHNLPIERLRELRDRLRDRVWRLVAKQGWYRLQPARAAMRSTVVPCGPCSANSAKADSRTARRPAP